jgi:hypothetical protein
VAIKICNVLIEKLDEDTLSVWADIGMKEMFEKMDGVDSVYWNGSNHYFLNLDKRFDTDSMKADIESLLNIPEEL